MFSQDIRFKKYLNDIMFPSLKEGMNSRSLAYLRVILMNKKQSVLFATLPKSGWNWTGDILTYCIVKHFTGKYEIKKVETEKGTYREEKPYRFLVPADSRATNYNKIRNIFSGLNVDYCFHTHKEWKDISDMGTG